MKSSEFFCAIFLPFYCVPAVTPDKIINVLSPVVDVRTHTCECLQRKQNTREINFSVGLLVVSGRKDQFESDLLVANSFSRI